MGWRFPLFAAVATTCFFAQDSGAAAQKGIPVLLFHAVCPETCPAEDPYGVSREQLEGLLASVKNAGYETISPSEYLHHTSKAKRPIVVTFDDSRLDSYVNADPVLGALGMRATMYVITANTEAKSPKAMSWKQIEEADRFGRWDIQLHADAGHVRIPTKPSTSLPFFANRHWSGDRLETLAAWKARAQHDLANGNALLRAHVPSYRPDTFAVPFGDYGQKGSNDPAIEPALRALFDREFPVWFTQPSRNPPTAFSPSSHEQPRYTIYRETTPEKLLGWLNR